MKKHIIFLFYIFYLSCSFKSENESVLAIENYGSTNIIKVPFLQYSNSDTIEVIGLPFEVNGLSCYWKYFVNIQNNINHNGNNVLILYQKLVEIKTHKSILEAVNSPDNFSNLYKLEELKNNKSLNLECIDINMDSYCDYQVMVERAAGGSNITFDTFLFNPSTKFFERSAIFSGTNLEYDSLKNRISTMWKLSVNDYTYEYLNLKPNRKEIESKETIHQYGDTVTYRKTIDTRLIQKKKLLLLENEDFERLLEEKVKASVDI